jgi:dihydroorotate dehydrogenase (fumarate)
MDLTTSYMGLKLKNPIIVSSSKLTGSIDSLVKCQNAGAGALVLKSVFEEQIKFEAESSVKDTDFMYYYFPEAKEKVLGLSVDTKLDRYLEFVRKAKQNLDIPVISSINCKSADDWTKFSKLVQDAGADAIELNIAVFPFNSSQTSNDVEDIYLQIVDGVLENVSIPVSVKLSPYFTNVCNVVNSFVKKGVSAVVLFNRLFRPDFDIDTLEPISDNDFTSPEDFRESMRWIALMYGNDVGCDLSASTGIHDYAGVVKQLLSGASAVQICSTLYMNGLEQIDVLLTGLESYMKKNGYNKLGDFRGKAVPDTSSLLNFERIQFMKRDIM